MAPPPDHRFWLAAEGTRLESRLWLGVGSTGSRSVPSQMAAALNNVLAAFVPLRAFPEVSPVPVRITFKFLPSRVSNQPVLFLIPRTGHPSTHLHTSKPALSRPPRPRPGPLLLFPTFCSSLTHHPNLIIPSFHQSQPKSPQASVRVSE